MNRTIIKINNKRKGEIKMLGISRVTCDVYSKDTGSLDEKNIYGMGAFNKGDVVLIEYSGVYYGKDGANKLGFSTVKESILFEDYIENNPLATTKLKAKQILEGKCWIIKKLCPIEIARESTCPELDESVRRAHKLVDMHFQIQNIFTLLEKKAKIHANDNVFKETLNRVEGSISVFGGKDCLN